MATGEGKSVLFMLPAICVPGGLTVVVVPLVALRQDMIQRCRGHGIKCAEWKAGRPMDDVSMVLVTPESAVSEHFGTFLNRVKIRLDRIVIDECHVILNDSTNFRRRMSQLGKLVNAEVQTVLLTATLPPSKEGELWKRMYWTEEQVSMFRARTTRRNIQYQVIELGEGSRQKEWDETVIRVAEAKHKQYYPGKVIVYANTVKKVKDLADGLGVDAYYSAADMKAEKFEDFRSGREQVIVATSALGLGVDIPDIRAVIHADQPRDLEDYVQESGRAGRDRQKSEAIIVICPSRAPVKRDVVGLHEQERDELVERYIQQRDVEERSRVCRRVILDRHMDGIERAECQSNEEACDVCCPDEVEVEVEVEEGEGEREGDLEQQDMELTRVIVDRVVERIPICSSQGVSEVGISEVDIQSFRQEQGVRSQPREQAIEQTKEEAEGWRKLEERICFWHGKCAICVIAGREDGNSHDLYQCRAQGSREAQAIYQKIRQGIVYMPGAACNNCGVPIAMCNRYSEGRDGNHRLIPGVQCKYRGTVISGWVGMMWAFKTQTFPRWEDQLGVARIEKELAWDFTRGGLVSSYLGERIELNGQGVSRIAIEFSKMASRVRRQIEEQKRQG
jgi:superfamily II DNA/RNA helicase